MNQVRNDDLERFATTINNYDSHLPKGTSRCFNIGSWGGCSVDCPALHDGQCESVEEFRHKNNGDMVVSSNGVCDLSTPVWNAEAKEFSWTAAAPHFAADGTTPNMGFYKAVIPAADAKLLWGLDNPTDAVKALSVQVTTTESGSTSAVATIGVKNGKIIIDVSGFGYSRPKLKIALKKSWKPATTMLNKTTITCILGKSVKKITAVKPTCPKGYVKK